MMAPIQPSVGVLLPPVLISFVALVLGLIALLAGTGPQQESLEPYHIVAVRRIIFGDLAMIIHITNTNPLDKLIELRSKSCSVADKVQS